MKRRTVLSLEQATALPYATLRFVQLGWRVIRIEATGDGKQVGDPNRYAGHKVAGDDRHAAYIAPNVGKESIGLNLKSPEGQAALRRLVRELDVDLFCCNVLPMRYEQLGISYDVLSQEKPDLIWAGISALGPEFPTVAGYDPIIQAMSGMMEVNGLPENAPTLIGLPVTDLKAGDELYSSVMRAMLSRAETGRGERIDVSMLQAAMSWLIAVLPLVDLGADPAALTRTGNAHRQFVPTNVYPTSDGFIYLAIGSNGQWKKFASLEPFQHIDEPDFDTLNGRYDRRHDLYRRIGEAMSRLRLDQAQSLLRSAGLPHSTINTVPGAMEHEAVRGLLTRTQLPDGRTVRLPPAGVTVPGMPMEFELSPRYGAHTDSVFNEAGFSTDEIKALRASRTIA
jgi:crotonobetainyl-CoA:carnitine CoA-transferase CaiB-like acyl-CoA transferase